MSLRRVSGKRMERKARLRGAGSVANVMANAPVGKGAEDALVGFEERQQDPSTDPRIAFAARLVDLAAKSGQVPKRGRGRPKAAAVAPQLSRQQRRHRERMIAKAAHSWQVATEGKGVTLVGGKPVPVKGVKS